MHEVVAPRQGEGAVAVGAVHGQTCFGRTMEEHYGLAHLRLIPQAREFYAPQEYKIMLHNTPVGTITVQYMDILNGEAAKGSVYLSLMLMDETYRGKGWGTLAMQLLGQVLRDKGYQQLHLDTASTNVGAQRFYMRIGFHNRGRSRSYIYSPKRL